MGTIAATNSQSAADELKDAGLLLSTALIGDKWTGAADGRTIPVSDFLQSWLKTFNLLWNPDFYSYVCSQLKL
jgi:hypothetical protein